VTAANDFNYKVALATGLRDLQSGRLGQAEEQFRYLVAHFPAAGAGYRGLARVLLEQEDRAAALATLRAGAASLAKGGDRAGGIALLREAILLGPSDPAIHRHLAAALGLAGDHDGAVAEQRRFAHAAIDAGERDSALREIRYALSVSGDDPALVSVAVECSLPVHGFGAGSAEVSPDGSESAPDAAAPAHDSGADTHIRASRSPGGSLGPNGSAGRSRRRAACPRCRPHHSGRGSGRGRR